MGKPGRLPLRRAAEEMAGVLPPLLVAAERVAATVFQGVHGRRRSGPGEDFWQFRRYQPGEPAQRVDWRRSGRSDDLYVRETEWSAAQTVFLWCDASPSMNYSSRRDLPSKRERAALLGLAAAALLLRGGERVAMTDLRPPAAGRNGLARLARRLEDGSPDAGSLPRLGPLPRHATALLIGDWLAPLDDLGPALRAIAGRGVRGHLVQVLDPAEEALPFAGRVLFAGPEGEGEWLAGRAEGYREAYRAALAAHRRGLAALAREIGWTCAFHHTSEPPGPALLALHQALSGEGGR